VKTVIIIALVALLVVAMLVVLRSSGPRVTHIETRREQEDEEDRDL
jgi:hypothetical protein